MQEQNKKRLDAFFKKREKVVKIIGALTSKVYPGDDQMAQAVSMLIEDVKHSDEFTDELAEKLLGFYIWMRDSKRLDKEAGSVLAQFFHDIGGLVRKERAFLPRTEMYRKFYKHSILEE